MQVLPDCVRYPGSSSLSYTIIDRLCSVVRTKHFPFVHRIGEITGTLHYLLLHTQDLTGYVRHCGEYPGKIIISFLHRIWQAVSGTMDYLLSHTQGLKGFVRCSATLLPHCSYTRFDSLSGTLEHVSSPPHIRLDGLHRVLWTNHFPPVVPRIRTSSVRYPGGGIFYVHKIQQVVLDMLDLWSFPPSIHTITMCPRLSDLFPHVQDLTGCFRHPVYLSVFCAYRI